jgi:predicted PurR-regulated permease PerM
MEKKKFTSWVVSFASLALVAGMMSYMGITNKDTASKTNTLAQAQVTTQSTIQQAQSNNTPNQVPNQTSNNSESQQSFDQSISDQHGGFDTTTGGT